MRILLDCSQVRGGGGIQSTLSLLGYTAQEATHEWHVVVSKEMSQEVAQELKGAFASFTALPPARSALGRVFGPKIYLPHIERRVDPDLVVTAFGPAYWRPKARHVVGFAFAWIVYPRSPAYARMSGFRRRLFRLVNVFKAREFQRADGLICETEAIRQRIHSVLKYPLERIRVVGNTYSPTFARTVQRDHQARDSHCFRIAVPAQYYPNKNLELIPATARLLEEQLGRPFEFVFTLDEQSPGWRRLCEMALRAGVPDRIRTMGTLRHEDIWGLYRIADAVFLPTLLECSTAVYPESFHASLPLATSDIRFARDLCGNAALYFDPQSPQAASDALLRIARDDQLRSRLVAAGRETLSNNYATPEQKWAAQLQAIEEFASIEPARSRQVAMAPL